MKSKTLTNELKINSVTSISINLVVAIGLLIGTASTYAGDNDLWREQVAATSNVAIASVSIGKGGSSFLDAVRDNHFPYSQKEDLRIESHGQLFSDKATSNGNWFLKAVSPNSYNYGS